MYKRIFSVAALILLALGILLAQEYQVEVTNIQVWVKAVDKSGNAVRGLSQSDFELYEDDVKLNATCFEEMSGDKPVAIAEPQTAEVTAPRPERAVSVRKFVLFLDLYNTSPAEYGGIRPKMQEFVTQLKDRNSEVMVAALTSSGKLGIIAPFTRNLDAVSDLLNRAPANEKRDSRVKTNIRNLELLFTNMDELMAMQMFRSAYTLAERYANEEKTDAQFTLAALDSFAAHAQQQRNGEHLVILLVSGGFNADPGRMYYDTIDRIAENRGYSVGGINWANQVPNSVRKINFDVRREVESSVGRLNRQNVTLYTVNTRGMYVPGGSITAFDRSFFIQDNSYLQDYQESLAQVADETGGTAFMNSQNFKLGFDRVLEDLDHQYILCFSPPAHPKKGDYHRIKVVSKKPGVNLRYRKGYVD